MTKPAIEEDGVKSVVPLDHMMCLPCFEEGHTIMLCGTPLTEATTVVPVGTPIVHTACFVCFANPTMICNRCKGVVTCL